MSNALSRETSPYLLQHQDNPVDWHPWGEQAFAEAHSTGKPILLSVGYAACHWCHVMAHESFEHPAIASLMNDLFVNIKVDREERPEVDHIYQQALALLGEQGGWPLTMFLTPEGEPFWGGTYFPPESRWGRPGFPDVLRAISATFRNEPDKIARNVTGLNDALGKLAQNQSGQGVDPSVLDRVAEIVVRQVDPFHGGLGEAPKFPNIPVFEMLWRAWLRTARQPYMTAVTQTLTAMCQGGIYDHLGGGFSRYSVDAEWLVPHFEKMLYDNAQLIDLLTLVGQETKNPLFATRVEETVDWLLREMVADGGGFAATLDADSEGEEGKFYVWTEAEIDVVLGTDAPLFKKHYDVAPEGNWEGHTILNRRHHPMLADVETETKLTSARAQLLAIREARVRPGWDDKVLADWNGLMITALVNAGFAFDRPYWIKAAQQAFGFVQKELGQDNRLVHAWRKGVKRGSGTLDDYAHMARAALALYEVTGDGSYLEQARNWADVLDCHFWDSENGGYFLTADDAERLVVRPKSAHDQATPSGNGAMIGVLARLYLLTGEDRYRTRADELIRAFAGELSRNASALATFLNGVEFLNMAQQIVIIGDRTADETRTLLDTVRQHSLPHRLLLVLPPETALPASHPAAGKAQIGGKATAYVCTGSACSSPVTTSLELDALLSA